MLKYFLNNYLISCIITFKNHHLHDNQINIIIYLFFFILLVYPQKQQYAYAGYPAPAAYPGPYYHGSQYGPYNY